jgi:predicted protein tyrosine phosphatase
MFIEALGRQMAVCSFDGAARLVGADKGYWNVVSIGGPRDQKAHFPLAKTVHYACFDDVEDGCSATYRNARASDIANMFAFIANLGVGPPPPPLLIHCAQGLSRSTAVALSWLYGQVPQSGGRLVTAIDLVLLLRPQAKPNRLVLTLGLAQFMPVPEARDLAERMITEPRLARNRFQSSSELPWR